MLITCPSCKRRFKLPVEKVRSRHAKLKCSRCKSVFVQDLVALAESEASRTTEAERAALAAAPSRPDMRVPPSAHAVVAAPRPGAVAVAAAAVAAAPSGAPQAAAAPQPVGPPPQAAPAAPVRRYESFADVEGMEAEHAEALERARAAAEIREQERLLAEAVEEAARAAADVPQATEVDLPVDVEETPMPAMPEPAPADLAGAAPPPGATQQPSARQRAATAHEAALELFGAVSSSGRMAAAGAAISGEYVLNLVDEEAEPSRYRWLGYLSATILILTAAFFVFVMGRNDWNLDFGRFGQQVGRAFGLAAPTLENRACVVAQPRMPAMLETPQGRVIVVRGDAQNICDRSIAGVRIDCTLHGPGGPWTDQAFPLRNAGASSLAERNLERTSPAEVAAAVGAQENSAGVVLSASTHEFWCVFPNAAEPSSVVTSFRPSVEVRVP